MKSVKIRLRQLVSHQKQLRYLLLVPSYMSYLNWQTCISRPKLHILLSKTTWLLVIMQGKDGFLNKMTFLPTNLVLRPKVRKIRKVNTMIMNHKKIDMICILWKVKIMIILFRDHKWICQLFTKIMWIKIVYIVANFMQKST